MKTALLILLPFIGCFCSNPPEDFSTALFSVSKEAEVKFFGRNISIQSYQQTIDSLAVLFSADLAREKSDSGKVAVLIRFVFQKMAMEPIMDSAGISGSMITRVLDERKGSCLGLTGIFLLIGRKNGLPLDAVLLPGHVFVRYSGPSGHINIETLRRGIIRSDVFYHEKFGVKSGHPYYMHALSDEQLIALFQMNLANEYKARGLLEEAEGKMRIFRKILPDKALL